MKLRYSTTSPFVRKVHVLAIETGQADRIELVKTNTADPASGLFGQFGTKDRVYAEVQYTY